MLTLLAIEDGLSKDQDLKDPEKIGVTGVPSHMIFRHKSKTISKAHQKTKLKQDRPNMHQFCLPSSAIYLPPRFQVVSQNVSGNIPANVLQVSIYLL